jgi:predicted RNA binding protein YcfA (HicA-like mRNA interferase family)
LIRFLGQAGFEGSYSGGRHQFMIKGDITLRLPNPHQGDIGKEFLARILRQAGIGKDEWERL